MGVNQSMSPILIRVYPQKRGWLDLSHFGSNPFSSHSQSHLIHSILFLQTNSCCPSPFCVFHVFGRPCFSVPFFSNSNTFFKTCPSFLLNTCPYHVTPFAFAIWTTVSLNPNVSIRSTKDKCIQWLKQYFKGHTCLHSVPPTMELHIAQHKFGKISLIVSLALCRRWG